MFNVYEFDRRCLNLDRERKKQAQSQLVRQRQRVKNDQYSKAYRERIGTFINKMINKSIE